MKKLYPIILLVVIALLTITSSTAQEESFELNFYFASLSDNGVDDEGGHDQNFMAGFGEFNFEGEDVIGGGVFNHFDANTGDPSIGTPHDLLATGTWEAIRVISFSPIDDSNNLYGRFVAGILEMEIVLLLDDGREVPATLTVISNIPPAGMSTGEPEGFILDISVVPLFFEPASFPETPFSIGATSFSLVGDMD